MGTLKKNIKQVVIEGRYDSFTRKIVKDIMSFIKKTEGNLDDEMMFELPYDLNEYATYIHDSGIEFEVSLSIKRTNDTISYGHNDKAYYVNTYIDTDNILVVELILDETYGRIYYQQIFNKINEDVRHEIEHYVQQIDWSEKMKNKERGEPNKKRRYQQRQQPLTPNTASYNTTFQHHKDPSEIEALVHGFYRRAKIEKKTLDSIMIDDIKRDIEDGNLTTEEGNTLLRLWVKYAVKNLPHAQYSTNFRRKYII